MSETIGSPLTARAADEREPGGVGLTTRPATPVETVREAYSFACLSCGYGWEQAYDIEHHHARDGHVVIEYHANGVRVPSPLLKPTCPGCGGHTVRIMREGRVATVEHSLHTAPGYPAHAGPADPAAAPRPARRHWYSFFRR
ncbi:hypothetical protein CFP65_4598 [Kitasatospora sp. MMS16-BH015]|uniref:hypothetical protein n=1 Tax=Kitasatospora sp. MMS16-BH015 TaxID=2018025 RepID=UPI000CA148CB|nr:hypothetical protein [Kitasatospora sp. MMS16-BH015]AUG79335.1 hypothetical protein CFP65_4598 [Kitasatospora sp. MMS16-BH015]